MSSSNRDREQRSARHSNWWLPRADWRSPWGLDDPCVGEMAAPMSGEAQTGRAMPGKAGADHAMPLAPRVSSTRPKPGLDDRGNPPPQTLVGRTSRVPTPVPVSGRGSPDEPESRTLNPAIVALAPTRAGTRPVDGEPPAIPQRPVEVAAIIPRPAAAVARSSGGPVIIKFQHGAAAAHVQKTASPSRGNALESAAGVSSGTERLPEQTHPSVPRPELPASMGPQQATPPRARHPWARITVLCFLVFAFTCLAWVYWQDESPPSEATLNVPRQRDDSATVAAPDRLRVLLTSVAPIQSPDLLLRPPWTWETPALAQLHRSNGVAIQNLKDLLEDVDWHPRHVAWHAADLGSHEAWTSLAVIKQAEAAYLARRGDEMAAFSAAIDLAELARRLQDLWAWPSYYDRALQVHQRCCQLLAELLSNTRLRSPELESFQNYFADCVPSDEILRDALGAYYLFEKKLMLGPVSGEPLDTLPGGILHPRPGRLFFKPRKTLALFVRGFRDLQDEALRSPYSRVGQVHGRLQQPGMRVGLPNSAGESYFAARMSPYVSLPERQSIAHAKHRVVLTLFAIRRFMQDYRRVPPKLLNLQSAYLREVPVDPFSGEPLKYDSIAGVVYSVGVNLRADGKLPGEVALDDPSEIMAPIGALPPP